MARIAEAKRTVKIPEGVQVTRSGDELKVKGPKGEIARSFVHANVKLEVTGNEIVITCPTPRRSEKAMVGTLEAHLVNMVKGVSKGFEYTLKTVYSHFPIKASVKGTDFVIENFLGERHPRKAAIVEGVKVQSKGETVTVSGFDKEAVGQTAANIERATKVTKRDTRVFQDGIYIISKGA